MLQTKLLKVIDHDETSRWYRRRRKNLGLTYRQISRRTNLSISFLCDLEKGRRKWNKTTGKLYNKAIKFYERKRK
jgi:transcriptional regulator with XRE-family HTH domain|tara:strand:+ start:3567 stop:3791 length:225 start_codon:yes stop_codon:yes gene_type:complete